jgi:hypothetical protein
VAVKESYDPIFTSVYARRVKGWAPESYQILLKNKNCL